MLNFFKKYYKYCLLSLLFFYLLKNKNVLSSFVNNFKNSKESVRDISSEIFNQIKDDPIKKDEMDSIKNTFAESSEQKEKKTQSIQQFETEITPMINKKCESLGISLVSAEYTSIKKQTFSLIENYVNQAGASTEVKRGLNEIKSLAEDVMPVAGAALMIHQSKDMFKKDSSKNKINNKEESEIKKIESRGKKEGVISKIKRKMKDKNKINEENKMIEMKDNIAAKKANSFSDKEGSGFSTEEEFEEL